MPISDEFYPREHVADRFAVTTRLLMRYERRGLVHTSRRGETEGYDPSQVKRIWTIVSLQRDLGINLAGVEAVVKLREHVEHMHAHLNALASRLRDVIEDGGGREQR